MKKQYFISLFITCVVIFNVQAQNTPIDDFLKKHPSMEGVTSVSMSQQMLKSIFEPTNLNFPDAYNSLSVSDTDISANLFSDFRNMLLSSKYEQSMEVNNGNNNMLSYFLKEVSKNRNEIVVLRQQENLFSVIYIKGNIEFQDLDRYLRRIKSELSRKGALNAGLYQPNDQFAFTMPSFDDFNFPNFQEFDFKFDADAFNFKIDDDLKLRMEESMKKAKEMFESDDFKLRMEESMQKMKNAFENEDFQRKIKESTEDVHKWIEDAKRQIEEIKQAEED